MILAFSGLLHNMVLPRMARLAGKPRPLRDIGAAHARVCFLENSRQLSVISAADAELTTEN
ncbi:MAG TPA: hypothetical protein VEI03_09920 [Stellaceae bacterium]|nr:hypothetical protein [Stellaceae bacterium]